MSKRRIVVKASAESTKRRTVQASKSSTDDMLNAFEARLKELGVESSTSVEGASAEINCAVDDDRTVYISQSDYSVKFKDVGGAFDSDGEIINLGEIKEYWNENNEDDPILAEYSDFDSWWIDTRNNYLQDYYEDEFRY